MARRTGRISKCIVILLLFLMFVFACSFDTREVSTPKSVLILNSYSQSYTWTDEQNTGILKVLNSEDDLLSVHIEYMDWKNYPDSENLSQLKDRLNYKYSGKKIDIIVTTDDAALKFALEYRKQMFSDAPVIFCGVNERGLDKILKDHTNVTGIVEAHDPAGTFAAALKINPAINLVYVVFDNTESGLSIGEITIKAIKKADPGIRVVPLADQNIEAIFQEVSQAPDNSIVICTSYTASVDGTAVGYDYFYGKLSRSSRVPVYHFYDFGIGNGSIGGSVNSGKLNGEEAARLAIKVLNGEEIYKLPFVREKMTHYLFDYKVLQRFMVDVNLIPEGSVIINKPFTFLEEYRGIVVVSIIVLVFLLTFIIALLVYLRQLNSLKKELSKNNKELTDLYEDLKFADGKLKKQYDELVLMQNSLNSTEYRFELLFDKMMNGFFIFEPVYNAQHKINDMKFLKVNPGFYHQTNLPKTDLFGKKWSEVFGYPNHNMGFFQNLLNTGKTERFETYNEKLGTYNLVDAFLLSENQIGVVFENITDYKKAIKEVKTLNAELEKRVSERTAELEDAVKELESFSYTVSHDLKSPLRAVDGYSKILLDDLEDRLDEDSVQMLQNIRTISKEAIEMTSKLLQYSKTSRAELNKEKVNMEKKFIDVYNEIRLVYPERDISLVIETGLPVIFVDRVLFRILIQNILSNAIKFTKAREKSIITVGCTLTADNYVFYIKDNGVGFNMKYSGKLFSIFQRLHTGDEFEGSGIGLVTIKKIIEKHGGKVWIEGKVNIGATVYFTIPFAG